MELSICNLQGAGSFAGAPVEKEIEWEQGGKTLTATTFVRKLSYKSAVEDCKQFGTGDTVAGRIASCICDKNGQPVFTVSDITGNPGEDPVGDEKDSEEIKAEKKSIRESNKAIRERGPLDHNLTFALLKAIREVNEPEKKT